ncbi:MAG: amidohydrolase family protein [candidate division Zixibacteria bacterium]|nr:amidohydrolase family protein [candidate division Zixibacteria bacterium]
MNRLSLFAAVAAALLAVATTGWASTQVPGAAQDHPIALVGGTVHTVSGADIANGTVLFEDGQVTAVGTDVSLPEGTEQIDVTGKHVYPGLIDAYSRIGLIEIGAVRATRDYAETGPVNPNVRAEVAVNPSSEIIPVTRSNGVLTALTVPRSGIMSGQSALLNLDGWTWEDMTLKAPVAMQVDWPRMVPYTGWWSRTSPEEQTKQRNERLKRLDQAFEDARAYRTAKRAPNAEPLNDIRWEAMLPVLDGELPIMVAADGIQQIQAAVAFAEREDVELIIVGGYDAPKCIDLLKRSNVPVIISETYRNPRRRGDDYDAPYVIAKTLLDAGVPFCIAGGGGASNERNLPYHAARAAAFGLPPDEALRAITLHPARILGAGERIGSLETGKDATIIVTDGDILEITSHVERAFIQGRTVDLSDKQKLLWQKYQEKYDRQSGN